MAAHLPLPQNPFENKSIKNWLFLVFGLLLALLIRWDQMDFLSLDYYIYLNSWVSFIRQENGINALGYSFSNYNPPYLYLLITSWYIFKGKSNVFIIKIVSIIFDFILSFFVVRIVAKKQPSGKSAVFIAVLLLPTVILNSATWGQSDSIYTTFLIISILLILNKQYQASVIVWAVAFAFKAQALFLFPIFLILFLFKHLKFYNFLVIPVVYILAIIPTWISGVSLEEIFSVYPEQVNTYSALTLHAPNLYQWVPETFFNGQIIPGILITIFVLCLFIVYVYKSITHLSEEVILYLSLALCLLLPFFLPRMHERYFYPADILALIVFFVQPKLFYVFILVELSSLFSYFPFLLNLEFIPLEFLAFFPFISIIVMLYQIQKLSERNSSLN